MPFPDRRTSRCPCDRDRRPQLVARRRGKALLLLEECRGKLVGEPFHGPLTLAAGAGRASDHREYIADISGTSERSSPQSCVPSKASARSTTGRRRDAPALRTSARDSRRRVRLQGVELTQMKWNGILSFPSSAAQGHHRGEVRDRGCKDNLEAPRPQKARNPHSHRLDWRPGAEFLSQPADAGLDDIRAWIEVGPIRRRAGAPISVTSPAWRTSSCRSLNSRSERSATSVPSCACRRARSSTEATPRAGRGRCRAAGGVAGIAAWIRDQLVERERLRDVVARAELEAAQLGRRGDPRREDDNRSLGAAALGVRAARSVRRCGAAAGRGRRGRSGCGGSVAAPRRRREAESPRRAFGF